MNKELEGQFSTICHLVSSLAFNPDFSERERRITLDSIKLHISMAEAGAGLKQEDDE